MTPPLVYLTGASSGIGLALARHYAQQGARLALVARRGAEIEAFLAQAGLGPERSRAYTADVRDLDAITAAGRACIADLGLPDVVIANAGISVGVDIALRSDIDQLRSVFETNVVGMAATFQPFVAAMTERGAGTLVGIASVAGIRGLPGHAAYCASKAAAISMCESLRGECRGSGVKVVTICPGYVATPLTARNRYAMPFLMKPEDFARCAAEAIAAGTSYRVIPWQMGVVAKLLRLLPDPLFDRLLAGRPRKRRADE